jgi:two-component system phosphate regulon sensor histidine kinase PhoR
MADGLVVLDADARVLVYSAPAEALLGLEPGRLAVGARLEELAVLLELVDERHDAAGEVVGLGPHHTLHAELTRLPAVSAHASAALLVVLRDARAGAAVQTRRRDFVSSVSDEMRGPLAAIRGASATLLGGALDDAQRARHFVEVIEQHAVRLGQVLDDVGALANLEHGDIALQRRPLPVAQTIGIALHACREAALSGGVGLESRVAPSTPPLDGDADLAAHVMTRLIGDAVQRTPRGGSVAVTARSAQGPDGNDRLWVQLDVVSARRGVGRSAARRAPMRSAEPDRGAPRERFGLSLVRHIVRAHGGRVDLAAADGGAATTVLWPASPEG